MPKSKQTIVSETILSEEENFVDQDAQYFIMIKWTLESIKKDFELQSQNGSEIDIMYSLI